MIPECSELVGHTKPKSTEWVSTLRNSLPPSEPRHLSANTNPGARTSASNGSLCAQLPQLPLQLHTSGTLDNDFAYCKAWRDAFKAPRIPQKYPAKSDLRQAAGVPLPSNDVPAVSVFYDLGDSFMASDDVCAYCAPHPCCCAVA
ncbi:hypothetical protein MRX96_020004 [Rhipicephalus microplus]